MLMGFERRLVLDHFIGDAMNGHGLDGAVSFSHESVPPLEYVLTNNGPSAIFTLEKLKFQSSRTVPARIISQNVFSLQFPIQHSFFLTYCCTLNGYPIQFNDYTIGE
jgi:hypothetical protein